MPPLHQSFLKYQHSGQGTSKRNLRKGLAADAPQSLAMSLAFAAVSAALGAVVSQLSDRGSKAFVDHRHRKPSR